MIILPKNTCLTLISLARSFWFFLRARRTSRREVTMSWLGVVSHLEASFWSPTSGSNLSLGMTFLRDSSVLAYFLRSITGLDEGEDLLLACILSIYLNNNKALVTCVSFPVRWGEGLDEKKLTCGWYKNNRSSPSVCLNKTLQVAFKVPTCWVQYWGVIKTNKFSLFIASSVTWPFFFFFFFGPGVSREIYF